MTAQALTFAARASVRVPNRAPMIEPPRPELNEQALTTGPLTTMPRQPCLGDWESRDAF